ncbi:MAG: hypothetical protein NVS3B19_17410 [Ginsengibacter sp.]
MPYVIERKFDCTPEMIWHAITDRNAMAKWYFKLKELRAEPGFEFSFEGGPEDRIYIHECKVIDVITNKQLSYSWTYKDIPGYTVVNWELFPEGEGTLLKLTHSGLESFPSDNPDLAAHNYDKGWTHIINTSLVKYMEG